jgi:hypothetical protein
MGRPKSTLHSTTMTSVNLFSDKFNEFQEITKNSIGGMTFQKLANRSLYLYLTDSSFKSRIDNTFELRISGSTF